MTKFDYDFISSTISENRRAVMKDGLWGFVDEEFNTIVEPKYLEVLNYTNGFCEARAASGWGYIDINGSELCSFEFHHVFPFSPDGYAMVAKNFEYNLINSNGQLILDKFIHNIKSLNGICYVLNTREGQRIFMADSGIILNGKWDTVKLVQNQLIVSTDGKYGLLDNHGNYILPQDYDEICPLSPKHIRIKKDGKCGVYHLELNIFSDIKFNWINSTALIDQPVLLVKINNKYGLIDATTLKEVTAIIYDEMSQLTIKDNVTTITVKLDSKDGFIYIK